MDKKKLISTSRKVVTNWGEFFADPKINAISQATPITAAIAAFFGGTYQAQQFETMENFLHLIHARVQALESSGIDREFFLTEEGRRILGKTLRSIFRDNRKEKLLAMANLTINLCKDLVISLDEKELYVDILDSLNSLQLSILQRAVIDMRGREAEKHRGLGWEILAMDYSKQGISKPLLLQAIRALVSAGLFNQNDAAVVETDKTHFVTEFGEQFYDFISEESGQEPTYI